MTHNLGQFGPEGNCHKLSISLAPEIFPRYFGGKMGEFVIERGPF